MSQKVKDNKNRWRNKMVAFRMSPEEAAQLDMMAYTSGLHKQDYLIKRVLQQDVIILPNPRVHKALRVHLVQIVDQLKRLEHISSGNEILDTIRYLASVIDNMGREV